MQRARLFCLVTLVLVMASALGAQTISKEDQLSLLAPTFTGATGLFDIITADTLTQGDWSFSTYFNQYQYLAAPALELQPPSNRPGHDMDFIQDEFTASIGYGLTDRWELTLGMPYVTLDQNADDLAGYINGYPYTGKFTDNDIGNLRVGTKFGLLDSGSSKLALSAFWDVNTGHEDSGIATGRPEYGAGLHWTSGMVTAAAEYFMRPDRRASTSPEGIDFDMSDEVSLGVGLNYPLSTFNPTNWVTELNSTIYTGGERQPDDIVELATGLRHWFGDSGWGVSAMVRSNLTIATGSNTDGVGFGYGFGVHYTPTHLAPVPLPPPPAPVPVAAPPPPPAPVEAPPEPVVAPRVPQEILSSDIMFDNGSARLTNIAKAQLDDVALRMKSEPAATAAVTGYTDGTEKTGKGNDLDRRRAEAVRDYLVSRHGIDASRITTEAMGTDPARRANVKLIVP
ncbi:MAG: OmpA family protein [Thermoanaerobaculia bacterium]|jgi:outer membrane protein OmpA-like peptidoglycan-associated protein